MKIIIKKPKKAYEKWLKVAFVIGLIIVFYYVMKPEVKVVEQKLVTVPQASEDILRDKSEVFVNGFDSYISDIRWIDNQILIMKSNRGDQKDTEFEVDLDELSVSQVNLDDLEPTSITFNDQTIELYEVLDESTIRTLYFINHDDFYGIYAYDGQGNYILITDKMKVGSNHLPLFKLSENQKKMLYIEASTDRLVTYDFDTQKKKILKPIVTEQKFYENAILSPDGGYLIELVEGETDAFNCYGTDSGKLYVDHLEGVNPLFSKESDHIYYLYAGDMTSAFSGKRLGVVTLNKQDIQYLSSDSEEVYFKRMFPLENNQLLYLMGVVDGDHFIIDKVVIYASETNEKKSISALKGMQIKEDCTFEVNGQMLLLPITDTELTLLNLETQAVQNFYDLTLLSKDALYVKNREGFLLGYGNTIYRVDQSGKTTIYHYEGHYIALSISPEEDKMLIVSESDKGLNCVITFKLGIEY